MNEGRNGVTANTPKKILFGAGTIHKGLKYSTPTHSGVDEQAGIQEGHTYYTRSGESPNYTYTLVLVPDSASYTSYYEITAGGWNFSESLVGATSGGSKLAITPEITKIEVDGALVATKGLSVKTGEAATMEVNFIELTKDILKAATLGEYGTATDSTNFDLIRSKGNIITGDYWENIAFVGKTVEGRNIIAILDNALCTSGMELEGKSKEGSVGGFTFECHADISTTPNLDRLPWKIYYPKIV